MGWGHFSRSKRGQSLGAAELEGVGNSLGGRLASDDSVSTSQACTQMGAVAQQPGAAAAAQLNQAAVAQSVSHSRAGSPHTDSAMLTPPHRWPTPPRSEASCSTTVSELSHSGGASSAATPEPAACLASVEHSSRPVAMDTASPAISHLHHARHPHLGGGATSPAPGPVIAGGADEGRQPLPDPLAAHPRYRKIRDLNWGTSGFVVLALDLQTRQHLAIKFISRGRQHVDVNMKEISRELLNQRMCALHPNIVQLREVFLTADYLAVAMEYADGGDLSEHIDQQYQKGVDYMSEDDARWIFQQLIIAVDYCHRLGIANRDIKLDNMLLHEAWPRPQLKLCDFGFSKNEVVQSVSKSTCGTPEYMAPEVLFEMKYNGQDADVWSCGVSLYVMLTGVFPFSRPTDEAEAESVGGSTRVMRHMFRRIIAGDYFPVPELSAEAQQLLHHMFRPNPAERCTTEDIMAHPWFTKNLPLELAQLNDRLLAARAAEHEDCRRSLSELDGFSGPLPPQAGAAAAAPQPQPFHNPYSAANRRARR